MSLFIVSQENCLLRSRLMIVPWFEFEQAMSQQHVVLQHRTHLPIWFDSLLVVNIRALTERCTLTPALGLASTAFAPAQMEISFKRCNLLLWSSIQYLTFYLPWLVIQWPFFLCHQWFCFEKKLFWTNLEHPTENFFIQKGHWRGVVVYSLPGVSNSYVILGRNRRKKANFLLCCKFLLFLFLFLSFFLSSFRRLFAVFFI